MVMRQLLYRKSETRSLCALIKSQLRAYSTQYSKINIIVDNFLATDRISKKEMSVCGLYLLIMILYKDNVANIQLVLSITKYL